MDNDDDNCTPPDILELATKVTHNLLPEKSRKAYDKEYNNFLAWKIDKKTTSFSENIILAYLKVLSDKFKPSSMWAKYSMLKSTLNIYNNIDITKYSKVIAFLKRSSEGHKEKKSLTFTSGQVKMFLENSPDILYLFEKAPGPEPKWTGVFEAKNEHIHCSQRFHSWISGQDDCLVLNVYTPLPTAKTPLPVMVYIHGGGYRAGSGAAFLYGPDYFIKHGVILVTMNYRVEILGFLCLGIKEAPGNAGLKDQLAALKWIKKNIAAFGGNLDNITLFGESAGATSTLLHIVSPLSKGLFQRAIMQSGSAISPWSLQFEPLNTASRLAFQMGYNTTNPKDLYDIFMSKSSNELLKTRVPRTKGDTVLSENIFVPCVEKKLADAEQFLPDTPYNLIVNGQFNKIPIIMGYNNAEGYYFAGRENKTSISNMDFHKALPRDLVFATEKERNETAMMLKEIYMGEDEINEDTFVKFSFYEGDFSVVYPVTITADLLLKNSELSVYIYKICYDGWLNLAKFTSGFSRYPGVSHADEIFYMFKTKWSSIADFYEMKTIHKITSLWTNFAKYSDPTPEVTSLLPLKWQPASQMSPRLLVIDKEFSTSPLWDSDTLLFWNVTYTKYRRK